ncbi:MAG: hypothetical protein KDA05_12410, partial [Phycisphaerales bacterium]|nr:hypothetical protein [Phycisphaerales bacterium]
MPLPATGFAIATITNPGSALTDFSLMVDLSRMPASWWSAVDTTDGTRGRAATGAGVELACDWLDFNDSAETGWLRVKWSGTLAASGTQQLRIYPPSAGNSAVAAGDTYGRHNAYDASWAGYYPEGGAVSVDRTANAHNLTINTAYSGTTGPVGAATIHPGTTGYYAYSNNSGLYNLPTTYDFTVLLWASPDVAAVDKAAFAFEGTDDVVFCPNDTALGSGGVRVFWRDLGGNIINENGSSVAGSWHHYGLRSQASNDHGVFRDGAEVLTSAATGSAGPFSGFHLGAFVVNSQNFDGNIQEVQVHADARSDDWVAQEYDQTSDQAAFWGTWAWDPGLTHYTIDAASGTLTLTGQAAGLAADRVVAAAAGSVALAGQATGLSAARVLQAASGALTASGAAT